MTATLVVPSLPSRCGELPGPYNAAHNVTGPSTPYRGIEAYCVY
jgi:hypothetical protein